MISPECNLVHLTACCFYAICKERIVFTMLLLRLRAQSWCACNRETSNVKTVKWKFYLLMKPARYNHTRHDFPLFYFAVRIVISVCFFLLYVGMTHSPALHSPHLMVVHKDASSGSGSHPSPGGAESSFTPVTSMHHHHHHHNTTTVDIETPPRPLSTQTPGMQSHPQASSSPLSNHGSTQGTAPSSCSVTDTICRTFPVADPGFLGRGEGGANPLVWSKNLLFGKISAETDENEVPP